MELNKTLKKIIIAVLAIAFVAFAIVMWKHRVDARNVIPMTPFTSTKLRNNPEYETAYYNCTAYTKERGLINYIDEFCATIEENSPKPLSEYEFIGITYEELEQYDYYIMSLGNGTDTLFFICNNENGDILAFGNLNNVGPK